MTDKRTYKKYNAMDKHALNTSLIKACKEGDLELVRHLTTSPHINSLELDINSICIATQYGHLNIVEFFLIELKVYQAINYRDIEQTVFEKACVYGQLDIVKFLFTNPKIQNVPKIQEYDNIAIKNAGLSGNLELVQYLISSPELKEHADIHAAKQYMLKDACRKGYLDIVEFLCELGVDIHAHEDLALRQACNYNYPNIVSYLLFEQQIEISEALYDFLNMNEQTSRDTIYGNTLKMIEQRDFKNKLENNLENKSAVKRPKI